MAPSTLDRAFASASRHDLVLAVIPSAFVVGLLVASLLPLSIRTGITVASIVGALAVVDALFLNPPNRPEGPRTGA